MLNNIHGPPAFMVGCVTILFSAWSIWHQISMSDHSSSIREGVMKDFLAAARLSPPNYAMMWKSALVSMVVLVGSSILFNAIEKQIESNSSSTSVPQYLLILDKRNGYLPSEVVETLNNWGSFGRGWYLLFTLVDVMGFITAYRTLSVVLLNKLVHQAKSSPLLRMVVSVPVVLGIVDMIETSGHAIIALSFQYHHRAWWQNFVACCSVVNVIKWGIVKFGSVLAAIAVIVAFFSRQTVSKE